MYHNRPTVADMRATGVVGRLDVSRTHSSGYNNETYIISTHDTLQVGRFTGYPGPIHVELWKHNGKLHPESCTFEMSYLQGDYPEFLPRFETAYRKAHRHFQEAITEGKAFAVTQNNVLDAQVFVEAAHRSAQPDGQRYTVSRNDDLAEYHGLCVANGLMKTSLRMS